MLKKLEFLACPQYSICTLVCFLELMLRKKLEFNLSSGDLKAARIKKHRGEIACVIMIRKKTLKNICAAIPK